MPVKTIDYDRVYDLACDMYIADLEDGSFEYDDECFSEWLIDNEYVSEDNTDITDELREKYQQEYLDSLKEVDEVPECYEIRAGEYYIGEADDHGYSARFE